MKHQQKFQPAGKFLFVTLIILSFLFITNADAAAKAKKGYLGVSIQELTPSLKSSLKLGKQTGLLISEVVDGSPADQADLEEGDVILQYDGTPVEIGVEFAKMVKKTKPGSKVKIKILSDGETEEIEVEIGKLKKQRVLKFNGKTICINSNKPRLGVKIHSMNQDLAKYFQVDTGKGVLILDVVEKSPAEKGGLKSGDVIVKVNDEAVGESDDLIEELADLEEGDEVTIGYIRHGKSAQVKIELDEVESDEHSWFHPGPKKFMFKKFKGSGVHDIKIFGSPDNDGIFDIIHNEDFKWKLNPDSPVIEL